MGTPSSLGDFEQLVLLALVRLGDRAYGITIHNEIVERAGREVTVAAVYKTLERLEGKACVRSRMGDPTPERGGRARRYFALTPLGLRTLRSTHAALARLSEGLEAILEES